MKKIAPHGMVCPACGRAVTIQNEPHQLPVNSIINGRYVIGRTLGAGGFGITYIGYDLKMECRVAIKEFYMSGSVSRTRSLTVVPTNEQAKVFFSKGRERFLIEAKVLAQFLNEPNIVNVREYFEENGTAYIVMEYLEGRDLRHYEEENGPQSFDTLLELLEPAMKALGKVHEKGLIHRDISPANLMLLNNGELKVLDFGTARLQSVLGEKSLSIMLKAGYAPEEQYRTHGEQGPWTDVYAMCATFYRLLTGQTPPSAIDRVYEDKLEPPSKLGAKISPEQEAALMRGLAVRADERIRSMDELVKCLRGERKPKRLLPWKKITAAAAAVLILGAGVYAAVTLGSRGAERSAIAEPKVSTAPRDEEEPEGEWLPETRYMLVKKTETDADGKISRTEEYEYNEYGNTTKTLYTSYSTDGASYSSEYIRRWSEDGSYIEYTENNSGGESTITNTKKEYSEEYGTYIFYDYDEQGNLKDWHLTVSEDGSDTSTTYYYHPDGTLRDYFIVTEPDDANRIVESYGADGTISYRTETRYNEDGDILARNDYDKLFTSEAGKETELPLSSEEMYSYDEQGRMISGKKITYYGTTEEYTVTGEYEKMEILVWHEK